MRRKKVFYSLTASIEWRVVAFLLTGLFLWASGGRFWQAAQTALGLHLILFAGHTTWLYFRSGKIFGDVSALEL